MLEADFGKFTDNDKKALKRFLSNSMPTTADSADLFVRSLSAPDTKSPARYSSEDIEFLLNEDNLLEIFFAEHFDEEPSGDLSKDARNFVYGFYYWQEFTAEDFEKRNTEIDTEAADMIRDLSLVKARDFAKRKAATLEQRKHLAAIGSIEHTETVLKALKWKRYSFIAQRAVFVDKQMS